MIIPIALAFVGGFAATLAGKHPRLLGLPLVIGAAIGFASQAGLLAIILCILAGMAGAITAVYIMRR
jgi:uncharacterized membrane protein YqaE (UPF0057 family)